MKNKRIKFLIFKLVIRLTFILLHQIRKDKSMRKKQATPYSLAPHYSLPPYLLPHQLDEFESEFTLFDSQLDLRKLKESFQNINQTNQGNNQNYSPVEYFVNNILAKRQKCNFNEYINYMNEFFSKQDEVQLVMDILSENKKQIPPYVIKQILEESLNRQISEKQLSDILFKVFQTDQNSQPISKKKIINVLTNSKQNN